jgi:predicted SAM-dependent methyltransferase
MTGGNSMYKENWYVTMRFELLSFIRRWISSDKPKLNVGKNYLNLGCGPKKIPGMVNADFFLGLRKRRQADIPEWELDLRYPLNCRSEVFDGVFTSHVFEHLYPDEVERLMLELNRVMKKGAKLRIIVPNLEAYVDFYCRKSVGEMGQSRFDELFPRKAMAIRNLTQKYYHRSVWDFEEMSFFLINAGFRNVERRSFHSASDENVMHDMIERDWESLYVEAEK